MLGILGSDEGCPIARSLDVLGEKWSLMIVRDAFLGKTRFSDFRESLGIPREVLAARLASLESGGVLERREYRLSGARARSEYVLAAAGRDLVSVLSALGSWAEEHRPTKEPSQFRFIDVDSEKTVRAALTADGLHVVPRGRVAIMPLPGTDQST